MNLYRQVAEGQEKRHQKRSEWLGRWGG